MQEEEQPGSIRSELLERLRAMEGAQSPGSLADISYRRAREALERALEEARAVRLQAVDDARATRERELASLMDSLRGLRQSAESQIESVLMAAEIEAERIRAQARTDARSTVERATSEAAQARAEAAALRASAEERVREVDQLKSEFDALLTKTANRLGIKSPSQGWWRRITRRM
ncbi:MAG TPA: hypothetical protein VII57_00235 [Dehalococcoidia bacterium]